jgi:hypothetical protein
MYIPEEYIEGFTKLSVLDNGRFSILIESLGKQAINKSISKLANNVVSDTDLNKEEVKEIFYSIAYLVSYLEDEGDIEDITADVVETLLESGLLKKDLEESLNSRIIQLLKDKKIFYAYKSTDIITENSKLFISAKILTDIRPIFDLNPEVPPIAGVTLHKLHIHYQADSAAPHQDFYITLGSDDIQELLSVLFRAEDKEKSLQEIYKNSKMTNLEF